MENQTPRPVLRKLPGPKLLLKEAYKIYRFRIKTIWGIIGLGLLMTGIASALAEGAVLAFGALATINIFLLIILVPLMILLVIIANLVQGWYMASLVTMLASPSRLGVKQSFRLGLGRAIPFTIALFLAAMISGMATFLFVIPGASYFLSGRCLVRMWRLPSMRAG